MLSELIKINNIQMKFSRKKEQQHDQIQFSIYYLFRR
jgi:hypothetical protein